MTFIIINFKNFRCILGFMLIIGQAQVMTSTRPSFWSIKQSNNFYFMHQ